MNKWLLILIFIASVLQSRSQLPIKINRLSDLEYWLDRKEVRTIPIIADSADRISIEVKSSRPVNFSITDPNGQIVLQQVVIRRSEYWSEQVPASGAYAVNIENLLSFSKNKVHVLASLQKEEFIYGSGSNLSDSVLNERSDKLVIRGTFRIKKVNPKSLPYQVLKGDTIRLRVEPIAGKAPLTRISNDQGEQVFARLPAKEVVSSEFPVLNDGVITIDLEARKLFGRFAYPFKQETQIEVRKISPKRLIEIVSEEEEQDVPIDQDTVIEVFLDTNFLLGAVRDVIHPSKAWIDIEFEDPESILFWGILFGAGGEFNSEMKSLEKDQTIKAATGKFHTDPLVAYCLGEIPSLPKSLSGRLSYLTSPDIQDALRNRTYGKVEFFDDKSFVNVINKSESVGQTIYMKIVIFRGR